MKRFWWCWTILLGCGASLHAQPVEFPLGWYSFAEIARRMSVGGRTVVCAPELKSRMALLSVKPREWEQMRRLLECSLDLKISIENAEQRYWRLTRDPLVVKREKMLREKLAMHLGEVLQQDTQREVGQKAALLESLSLPIILKEQPLLSSLVSEFRAHLELLAKQSGNADSSDITPQILREALLTCSIPPLSETLQQWSRQIARLPDKELERLLGKDAGWLLKGLDEEARPKAILLSLGLVLEYFRTAPIALWMLRQHKPNLAIAAVENGVAWQSLPADFVVEEPLLDWFLRGNRGLVKETSIDCLGSRFVGVVEYLWNPSSGEVSLERHCIVAWKSYYAVIGSDRAAIETKTGSLLQLFEQSEPAYHSEYVQATQRHWQLLKEEVNQTPVGSRGGSGHLYLMISDWARVTRQEVVVELYPHRAACEAVRKNTLNAIASALKDEGVWRVEQVDGVWVWRNWLAFVDRAADFPLAALHQLIFSSRNPADWRRFVQQTTPTQAKWLMLAPYFPNAESLLGSPGWLGPLPLVGQQWFLFRLLERVPGWETRLRRAGELEYPLGQLPGFVLRRWVAELLQVSGGAFWEEAWGVCAWLGQEDALVEALQRSGRLRLTLGWQVYGEVLLGDKALINCPLPINLPKQK